MNTPVAGSKIERSNDRQSSTTRAAEVQEENLAEEIFCTLVIKGEQDTCRLCGNIGSDYTPIFDNDDLFIAEKIGRCLPIVVLSSDDLPSHVCPNCLQSLNVSYELILTSVKIDSQLRHQLAEFNAKRDAADRTNDSVDTKLSDKLNTDDILVTCTERLLNTEAIYGPIECEMCLKKFDDMNDFDRHIETEHLLAWPCSLCDKSFETSVKLISHKEEMHAGNVLICSRCVDDERSAHGLTSLAEMHDTRKQIIRIKRMRTRGRKKVNETEERSASNEKIKEQEEEKTDAKPVAMCDICKIDFGSDELLTAHRRIHEKKILQCYLCQTDASSIYELYNHKRETHNVYKKVQLKFVCDTCGKFFSNNWQWLEHREKTSCKRTLSTYTCKYCNNDFTTNFKLTRHLRTHKDEMLKDPSATIYRCVGCPKIFVDKEFYQKHRNVHDPACWDKFKCEKCSRSFRDHMRLREHQQSVHDGFKPHQCDVCGRTFHRLSNMRVHRKKHFGYKCEHCDEIFEQLRTLTDHINAVHDVEPSPKRVPKKPQTSECFICRYCGRKLTTHQSLLDHEHIHTGEKPHSCKICGKSFRSLSARWAHVQRHVKGTYICEHCGKSFSYKQNLTTHLQVHAPVESRKHRCSKCGKLFLRKSHLKVHMRIHDGVRPYTCDICQFSFTQIGDMKRHRARHANGEIRVRQPRTKVGTASGSEADGSNVIEIRNWHGMNMDHSSTYRERLPPPLYGKNNNGFRVFSQEHRRLDDSHPAFFSISIFSRGTAFTFPASMHGCSKREYCTKLSAVQRSGRNIETMSAPLDKIPDVNIDGNGTFKYILVDVHDDVNKQSKPIVRGYARCTWHADIYEEIGNELKPLGPGLDTECVGGGRIHHDEAGKKINVYGYSQGFGQADHQVSVGLLKKKYPDYIITSSNEGY